MTASHDDVREAVALGERDASVEEHLESCGDCARFARTVTRITSTAPALVGTPPAALADTVLTAVRAAPVAVVAAPSFAGRTGRRVLFAAAAAVAVFGAATLVATGEKDGKPVLVAAAERAEEAGGARVKVKVDVGVEVANPANGVPNFGGVPVEIGTYLDGEFDRMVAQFEQQMAQFGKQLEEFQKQLDAFVRGAVPAIPGIPTRPPRVPRPPRPPSPPARPSIPSPRPLPDKLTMGVAVDLDGRVDFEGGARMKGSVKVESGTVKVPATGAAVEIAVDGTGGVLRGAGGPWTALGGAEGPIGSLLLDAGAVPQLLRAGVKVGARAETIPGGTRYRYPVADLVEPGVTSQVAVDVGTDGRATRVVVNTAGSAMGTTWRTQVEVSVVGYGDVDLESLPSAAGTRVDASTFLYPFDPAVAIALGVKP